MSGLKDFKPLYASELFEDLKAGVVSDQFIFVKIDIGDLLPGKRCRLRSGCFVSRSVSGKELKDIAIRDLAAYVQSSFRK